MKAWEGSGGLGKTLEGSGRLGKPQVGDAREGLGRLVGCGFVVKVNRSTGEHFLEGNL